MPSSSYLAITKRCYQSEQETNARCKAFLSIMSLIYKIAPTVQGTNSSEPIPNFSDFDNSPEAVAKIKSNISCPISWIVASPSTIRPQLMSISPAIRSNIVVFVANFKHGVGLHPKTEPRPVVKQAMLAPVSYTHLTLPTKA